MDRERVTLKEAQKFHGHLGPYLVLGILVGETALRKLRHKKYFGLTVKVWDAHKKPQSCLIDGLQLSTGATYGKGNIHKLNSQGIKVLISSLENNKKVKISLKKDLLTKLNNLKGHREAEAFARKLYKVTPSRIFNLTTYNL